ncbi:MAG: hypothetical protein U0168_21555 [Nannocystaceae bacterium]
MRVTPSAASDAERAQTSGSSVHEKIAGPTGACGFMIASTTGPRSPGSSPRNSACTSVSSCASPATCSGKMPPCTNAVEPTIATMWLREPKGIGRAGHERSRARGSRDRAERGRCIATRTGDVVEVVRTRGGHVAEVAQHVHDLNGCR